MNFEHFLFSINFVNQFQIFRYKITQTGVYFPQSVNYKPYMHIHQAMLDVEVGWDIHYLRELKTGAVLQYPIHKVIGDQIVPFS